MAMVSLSLCRMRSSCRLYPSGGEYDAPESFLAVVKNNIYLHILVLKFDTDVFQFHKDGCHNSHLLCNAFYLLIIHTVPETKINSLLVSELIAVVPVFF